MPKQYQITGLGPINKDGSRKIFTIHQLPFYVSAAWLANQTIQPDVGNYVIVHDDGTYSLRIDIQDAKLPPVEGEAPGVAQKKSHGSAEHGELSLAEFSSYKGKPIIVHASKITDIGEFTSDGYLDVELEGGAVREATPEMLARMTPVVGDYWVIALQDGGNYEYLNPKAVFENKYELMEPEHTV
jgi:hypothetical protein